MPLFPRSFPPTPPLQRRNEMVSLCRSHWEGHEEELEAVPLTSRSGLGKYCGSFWAFLWICSFLSPPLTPLIHLSSSPKGYIDSPYVFSLPWQVNVVSRNVAFELWVVFLFPFFLPHLPLFMSFLCFFLLLLRLLLFSCPFHLLIHILTFYASKGTRFWIGIFQFIPCILLWVWGRTALVTRRRLPHWKRNERNWYVSPLLFSYTYSSLHIVFFPHRFSFTPSIATLFLLARSLSLPILLISNFVFWTLLSRCRFADYGTARVSDDSHLHSFQARPPIPSRLSQIQVFFKCSSLTMCRVHSHVPF